MATQFGNDDRNKPVGLPIRSPNHQARKAMTMMRTLGRRLGRFNGTLKDKLSRVGGFTLIETVVALVLTGLLLSTLSTISGGWLKRWDAGSRRAQDVETLLLSANRIANDIGSAIALPATPTHPVPLFRGLERQLTLIREGGSPGEKGLEFIDLLASRKGGLLRARGSASSITSLTDASSKDKMLLLSPDFAITFAYRGSNMIWQRNWIGETLPSNVQMTISRQSGLPNAVWIFSVPIRAALPARCAAAGAFSDCELLAKGHQPETPTPEVSPPKLPKMRNPNAGKLP